MMLSGASLSDLVPYFTYDFERFSFASLETMAFCRPQRDRPRALAWPLLKAYYAGFFGAHGLLRSIGSGVVRIETPLRETLSAIGQIFCGEDFKVLSGNFSINISQTPEGEIAVKLLRLEEGGGAHQVFWKYFVSQLEMLINEVVTRNEPEASVAVLKATELIGILRQTGRAGGWLANVRSKINYQQQYEVWFPFGASQRDVDYVATLGYRSTESARLDFDPAKKPLQAFAAGSLFLGSLSFEVSDQLVTGTVGPPGRLRSRWVRLNDDVARELRRAAP
jgi:hypothetical protein